MWKELVCSKGHKKIKAQIVDDEECEGHDYWVEIYCPTCHETIYSNAA